MTPHILSLGAGVQSTTLLLLALDGELTNSVTGEPLVFDACIFADTQDEPADVYTHLDWLDKQLDEAGRPAVLRRSKGCLGDALIATDGERFASIPAFTTTTEGEPQGITRRQCTREYKVEVIERTIRREILKLNHRERIPPDVVVHQYMGFSTDEPGRAARARLRWNEIRWGEVHFPLFDEDVFMSRGDCMRYLVDRVPHHVPRSACMYCPFKSNREWRLLKTNDPGGWDRACEVDEGLRNGDANAAAKHSGKLYVHRSCRPLREAYLNEDQMSLFDSDCEGGCGL